VDLHPGHGDQPGDALAGSGQADDGPVAQRPQAGRPDRAADRDADRLHHADGAAARPALRPPAGRGQPGAGDLRPALDRAGDARDDVRAWCRGGARQLACAGCGRHAVRQLRGLARTGVRQRRPADEGNRLRGGEAGRWGGHGADRPFPGRSRNPGDRPRGSHPAGGEHAGRLRRAWAERSGSGQDPRRRARGGGRGRLCHCRRRRAGGHRDRNHPRSASAGHRHRRVGRVRRAGAGDRGHAGPVRAHAQVREALRRSCRPDRASRRGLCRGSAGAPLPHHRPDVSSQTRV
ncbi:MAG: 3-methyl-2-oxobutanoate hydroxymethyltransferase, partial [uncultured Sphingomonas sp.]